MRTFLSVAAALATVIAAQEPSTITLYNNCDFDVSWKVDNTATGKIYILETGAIDALELVGAGNALKFVTAAVPNFDAPISFDYSVPEGEPEKVYYDVSNQAGDPFGVWAVPAPLSCEIVGCPPTEMVPCSATRTCASSADFEVFLCSVSEEVKKQQRMRKGARA